MGVQKEGFLNEDTYTPDYTSDYETCPYNGYTYYFMGPGQVYRRAKFCVENNVQGIFYWDMGNDVATAHPYSLPKACAYALNSNVDSLVTEVVINHPTGIRQLTKIDEAKVSIHLNTNAQILTAECPSGFNITNIQLYATSGKCMAASRHQTVSTKGLPRGVYMARISMADGTVVCRKFINN